MCFDGRGPFIFASRPSTWFCIVHRSELRICHNSCLLYFDFAVLSSFAWTSFIPIQVCLSAGRCFWYFCIIVSQRPTFDVRLVEVFLWEKLFLATSLLGKSNVTLEEQIILANLGCPVSCAMAPFPSSPSDHDVSASSQHRTSHFLCLHWNNLDFRSSSSDPFKKKAVCARGFFFSQVWCLSSYTHGRKYKPHKLEPVACREESNCEICCIYEWSPSSDVVV